MSSVHPPFTLTSYFIAASYLPNPGPDTYQFVYVDARGEVCGISSPFLFSTPGALDELVTLENERSGEGEDLLLVVPKAQILQVGLHYGSSTVARL